MHYILYNPKANTNKGEAKARTLDGVLKGQDLKYINVLELKDYRTFASNLKSDDVIVIVGGDGSLNHFANDFAGLGLENKVLYYAAGTGNDFLRDLDLDPAGGPYDITKYMKDLPSVKANGKSSLFLNGIGYGIDGYCCEVADQMHAAGIEEVNYSSIAIKGLLGKYKPRNAKVTVDGKTSSYNRVWLAATMNGRFYGGGMMNAPRQDRLNKDRKLTLIVFHGSRKLHTLMMFPSIFKGEHVKHTKNVAVLEGYDITVEFDSPCALQIDGETVLAVSKYNAKSSKLK